MVSCQHCGAQASELRVMCPQCRRRLRPVNADPITALVTSSRRVTPDAPAEQPTVPLRATPRAPVVTATVLPAEPPRQPSRRPAPYVGGIVLAAVAALIAVLLVAGGPAKHKQPHPSALTKPSTTPSSAPASPAPVVPVVHHYAGPLERITMPTPHGWKRQPRMALPATVLARNFRQPRLVQKDLQAFGYHRGVDVEVFRPTPRIVVNEELWQFGTVDGATGWLSMFERANQPHKGSTYAKTFAITGTAPGRGYLGRARDKFGFSYGIAVARVDNIVVHVRYASVSRVTPKMLIAFLERAVKTAVQKAHIPPD